MARRLSTHGLKLALAALSVAGSSAAYAQTIIQYTQRALPSEPINIMGDGFNGPVTVQMAQISSAGALGTWTTCRLLAQSQNVLQVSVPSGYVPGVWALHVYNPSGVTSQVYINQPEVYFVDSAQASPGESIHLYGRNLEVLGTQTVGQVKFVSPSGSTLDGTVTAATPYCYTVTVPAGAVPGTSYSVEINNGYAGGAGQATAPTSLLVHATAPNPFGLSVWWGQQFSFAGNVYNVKTDPRLTLHAVGNGLTNDLAAIQAAVLAANKAGGGVVYLPTGTYEIANSTTGLQLRSNVVIKGDGPSSSLLVFGDGFTPQSPPTSVEPIRGVGLSLSGLTGLGIYNENTSTTPDYTIRLSTGSNVSSKVFVTNCNIQERNGWPMMAPASSDVYIANNTITTLNTQDGPLTMVGTINTTVQNNTICYRNGRLRFQYDSNLVFTNNSVKRDNNFMTPNAIETGGIELSCDRLDYVANNVVAGLGPFPAKNGCGEMINTQRSSTPDEEDLGTVTSATSSTLTNSKAAWETSTPFTIPGYGLFNRSVVYIVAGKGVGQSRTIASNTATTLTLTQPWDVVPDSTSTYSIGFWAADRLIITNNTISNSTVGIEFWEGANGCVVDSNTITNSGKILLRTVDILHSGEVTQPGPMKGRRHTVAWGNWIANNTIVNTSGKIPAAVSVYALNNDAASFGNLVFGTEVRNNTLKANIPNTIYKDEAAGWEGYWNFVKTNNGGTNDPFANFATLLVGNQSLNLTQPYNTSGAGLLQLVLKTQTINP